MTSTKKGKAKPIGEFPECVPFCPTMRIIREAEASCASCELRTKKASEIKLSMGDFFKEADRDG